MKVKYFATLFAAISVLSISAVAPNIFLGANTAIANPCASKSNPCAGKKSANSVGGKLAPQLQGKPVVIDIYASWCPGCKTIAPTVSKIKQQYAGKIHFITLDVTDRSTTAKAMATAKKLGLSKFLNTYKNQTATVTIVDPATGNILAQHRKNPDFNAYTTVLDSALAQR